jgi:hypothetical protein
LWEREGRGKTMDVKKPQQAEHLWGYGESVGRLRLLHRQRLTSIELHRLTGLSLL